MVNENDAEKTTAKSKSPKVKPVPAEVVERLVLRAKEITTGADASREAGVTAYRGDDALALAKDLAAFAL